MVEYSVAKLEENVFALLYSASKEASARKDHFIVVYKIINIISLKRSSSPHASKAILFSLHLFYPSCHSKKYLFFYPDIVFSMSCGKTMITWMDLPLL